MQKLVDGIHKFQSEVFGSQRELFERLAKKQEPDVLFITCSDSRVNPNLLTQTSPGDLFILRNAGNIIPAHGSPSGGEAATVEFAVTGLGVEDIIVCGHTHCGAMKGLLDGSGAEEMPLMTSWLGHAEATRRIMRDNYGHLEGPKKVTAAVEENVLVQLEHLRTHPAVASALNGGRLHLHGWVYKIESGEVFHYDSSSEQFALLTGEGIPPPMARRPSGTDTRPVC